MDKTQAQEAVAKDGLIASMLAEERKQRLEAIKKGKPSLAVHKKKWEKVRKTYGRV